MTLLPALLLMAICVAAEAFFSGSEIAMINADRTTLRARADEGDRGAALALDLLADEATLLGTCLTGTQLCIVTGASIATHLLLVRGYAESWAVTLLFTPVVLVLGEALPKTVMQHHADSLAPRVAIPLSVFRTVFKPFLWVVAGWNAGLSRLTGSGMTEGYLTRQELMELLEPSQESPIDPEERRLIRGVLSLQQLTAGDCMTPLIKVVAVAADATVGVTADIAVRTQHSRLPVYAGRIDHIVGIVQQADLLFLPDDGAPLAPHVRPVVYVPDAKSADALFGEMRTSGEHFVVVVDEYGGCVGIVTLEDLLEQFVGDIHDERDTVRPALVAREDGSWSVPGATAVDDVAGQTGLALPEGDYETLAGLVLARLGRFPAAGESIEVHGVRIEIEEATDHAIVRLRLVPPPADAPPSADA